MMRKIAMPGDIVFDSPVRMGNTYVQNGKTYSKVLGMYDERSGAIIPLEGSWVPDRGDSVVGIVTAVKNKVYIIDLLHFGKSLIIPGKYDDYSLSVGDIVTGEVNDFENRRTVIMKEIRKLEGGTIVEIKPKKVLRVIGKKNTMVDQIAKATGSEIIVGLNGLVWISGGNVALAIEAVLKVEHEAHVSGLTEIIREFLEKRGN